MFAPEETQSLHNSSGRHIEVRIHPYVVSNKGPKFEHVFAANNIGEKRCRLLEIRDRETDVLSTPKTWQA